MSSLKHLTLNHNDLGAKGMRSLSASLPSLTALETLSLYSNDLGDRGAAELASSLGSLSGSLTSLNLGLNDIGTDGVQALAPVIGTLTGLKRLSLCSADLSSEGARCGVCGVGCPQRVPGVECAV